LTDALQNQTAAFQVAVQNALQNVSAQATDLTDQLQSFLTNLQSELNATGTNVTAELAQALSTAIANLQSYIATNEAKLQTLIDTFGQNITTAVQNLQGQVANVTKYLQDGLKNLTTGADIFLRQQIQTLNNSLSSGALNQTLINLITELQGQTLKFQDLLSELQAQVRHQALCFAFSFFKSRYSKRQLVILLSFKIKIMN
jgi:hypothetical protein